MAHKFVYFPLNTAIIRTAGSVISGLVFTAALFAQQAPVNPPVAPDPTTMTQYGLSFADFVKVNEVMTQVASEDPVILELTRQIEALVAQRQALVIAAVRQKHPEMTEKVTTMKNSLDEIKRKAEAQAEQIRALQNGSNTVTLPPNG